MLRASPDFFLFSGMRYPRRLRGLGLGYPLGRTPAPPSRRPGSQAARPAVSSPRRFRPSSRPSPPPPPGKPVIQPGLASQSPLPWLPFPSSVSPEGWVSTWGSGSCAPCTALPPAQLRAPGSQQVLSKGLRIRTGNKSTWKGLVTLTGEFRAPRDHWAAPSHSAWVTLCYLCPALQPQRVLENSRFVERGKNGI